ncbi:MAG: hypothetical protein ABR608_09645 [Pseudonocardiaceae bacterium]
MAKNAGQTVAALLAKAPPPPRASASPAPALEPDPGEEDAHEAASGADAAPPAMVVTAPAAPPRGQERPPPRPAEPSTPAEPTAPPTLRLSQPTAEALRAAWLEEKRSRVLLTYQDFAGEIITAGLRQPRQHTPQQ